MHLEDFLQCRANRDGIRVIAVTKDDYVDLQILEVLEEDWL